MIMGKTPDGRPLRSLGGVRRDRDMFRWLMRRVTGAAHPMRGMLHSRTGRIRFLNHWKGGRHG